MAIYLLKTEPSVYSYADLIRDKQTLWDGVTNPQAVLYLRGMKKGDIGIIYHTGDERRAMGTAKVVSVDTTDPKLPLVTIRITPPAFSVARTLDEIKASSLFADSPLVRQGRLSVVPITEEQLAWFAGK
jgi:predicted RNA-binding protein with PUA-like domain